MFILDSFSLRIQRLLFIFYLKHRLARNKQPESQTISPEPNGSRKGLKQLKSLWSKALFPTLAHRNRVASNAHSTRMLACTASGFGGFYTNAFVRSQFVVLHSTLLYYQQQTFAPQICIPSPSPDLGRLCAKLLAHADFMTICRSDKLNTSLPLMLFGNDRQPESRLSP